MLTAQKTIFVSPTTANTSTTDDEGVGSIWYGPRGEAFRWVLNSTGAVTAVGDSLYHGTGNTKGFHSEVFQLGQSTKGTLLTSLAGVCVTIIASGSYGWIQIRGRCASVNVDGTTDVVVGDSLIGTTGTSYLIHGAAAAAAALSVKTVVALAGFTTNSTQSLIAGDIYCL